MENQTTISAEAKKLPGAMEIIEKTFLIYKKKFLIFLGISFVPYLSMIPLALIILIFYFFKKFGQINGAMIFFIILAVLCFLFIIFIGLWSTVAGIYAANNEKADIKESFSKTTSFIVPYIWLSFLLTLIFMGGLIFFIIPAIIFSIWFSFAAYVLVNENLRGFKAIKKSKEYVKGYWWAVFGRYLFFALLMIVLLIVFFILITVALKLSEKSLAYQIINQAFSILITPLGVIFGSIMYNELKKIKNS